MVWQKEMVLFLIALTGLFISTGQGINICNTGGVGHLNAGDEWTDLYSPNYPSDYGNNENCMVRILAPAGTVSVVIQSYSLEANYDYLRLSDDLLSEDNIGSYTGDFTSGMIIPVESSGREMFVRFSSDQSNTAAGFHLRFKAEFPIPDCPMNQVWNDCGTQCPLICGEPEPWGCTYGCEVGCQCPAGQWKRADGSCVTNCDCMDGNGIQYSGSVSQTTGGIQCMRWDGSYPHTPKRIPQDGGHHNYCRNPDNDSKGPWCYTSSWSKRWDYCDIPQCFGQIQTRVG